MEFKRFTKRNILTNILLVSMYLLWMGIVGNIKQDHLVLVTIWLISFYSFEKSRKLILGFSVFIVFWIIYDSMRIIPNYEVSIAHIKEPYNLEKFLFGFQYLGERITPNEYFLQNNVPFLDFLSGFFYINWMPVPIGFGIYLYISDKELFLKYSIAFLLVNIIGFIVYYIYPAAPPWYVQQYGFDLHIGIPGNRAGLERFDSLIGIPVFEAIYNKNANVLAAMPSLHSAYPVVVLFYAFKKRISTLTKILFVIFLFGIWFSAIYSSHHYIIDVIAGVLIAVVSLFLFEKLSKTSYFQKKITLFYEAIK